MIRPVPAEPVDALRGVDLPAAIETEVRRWLEDVRFREDRSELVHWLARASRGEANAVADLVDAFGSPLPIGTGGRRGTCGPGPNRINVAVLRETAQGLARMMDLEQVPRKVAVVYDTRRDSRRFARVVADQLARNGIAVLLVDAPRPTPVLSFTVRARGCGAGVVISASHNPPDDNGIKVYGADGAQVIGARDRALMRMIEAAMQDPLPDEEVPSDAVEILASASELATIDDPYMEFVHRQGVTADNLGADGLRIVYTPLHGVGHTTLLPVLQRRGASVTFVDRQGPDGGAFASVSSANPEAPEAFHLATALAEDLGADLVLATDPDADRLGAMARDGGRLAFIDGNRIGALLLGHILEHNRPPSDGWVLSTIVTTPLLREIATANDVEIIDDLLVGFKHHAGMIEEAPHRACVFAGEESHGYLRGSDVRDKDGTIAALLLCETAAICKAAGETLWDRLRALWIEHGYHRERTASLFGRGVHGRRAISAVVEAWRRSAPETIGGRRIASLVDRLVPRYTGSPTRDLLGNVIVIELAPVDDVACRLVIRPSGTEPKIKLYALGRALVPCPGPQLAAWEARVDGVVDAVLDDVRLAAEAIMQPLLGA